MRFIKDGPDIPDELLFAQDEGNVVFFCGAGVSMAHAKLSSFSDLAEKVITDLGATEESKAKKLFLKFMELNKDPHTRGVMSADHIFSGLIRSFDRNDINCSVARSLLPKGEPDLTAHKIILKLARSQGGQTRLITTNFDLLFEAASKRLKSVTRSNLPHVEFTDNDWGIVHLHGKVKKDYSAPDRDGFVLSSSEFGDAYLAQGWARNFVKDVLGKFTAVFIGYSADDPPVRYLLEGLQQSDGASHDIYAFQSADGEAIAQWDEKGVTPIVYDLNNNGRHDLLWNSLDAWSLRTKNPSVWKNKLLVMARKGPSKLQAHERGMVAHLVKSQSGAKAFEQKKPPLSPEWLCVFDPTIRLQQVQKSDYLYSQNSEIINPYQLYGIDSDPPPSDRNEEFSQEVRSEAWDAFALNKEDYETIDREHLPAIRNFRASDPARLPPRLHYLASWIAIVSDQRLTVWWAGLQSAMHSDLLIYINTQIIRNPEKSIAKPIIEAWNMIFELSSFYGREEYCEYDLMHRIKALGWSNHFVREYAKISSPFLKRGDLYNRSIPRDNRKKLRPFSLVSLDVDYPKGIYDISVPNEYLPQIVNAMRINLERAVEMEQDFSGWLRDICAIEPDGDNNSARAYGLSGYVLHFVNLFRKLCKLDIQQAKFEFDSWRRNDPAFTRLRVWACGLHGLVDEETFTNEILSLSDADFWPFTGERDLLISLRNKWNELSHDNRILIEKRILKRPPKPRKVAQKDHLIHVTHNQLNRLHWLNGQGCILELNLGDLTKKLRSKALDWKPEFAEKAAESHDVRAGFVRTDTDWSNLNNIPLAKIIENAKKKKGKDYRELTEYAPFSGLCDDMPLRALSALSIELKAGKFHSEFWEDYLSRETRRNDKYRLKLLTAGRITQIPNKDFQGILLTASRWFEDHGPELREKNPKMFEAIWDKFIQTITVHENASGSALVRQEEKEIDWTGEAINSASGNLAELHMTDPAKENLNAGKGYPKQWLKKVDQLLNLPNDAHRYAMVIFAFNLSWLHYIDPKWTEKKLIKIIENDKASIDDKAAIWAGFMWGARFPNEELYIKLKPHLLKMAIERASERRRHLEVLSALLLSGWGSNDKKKKQYVSDEELRDVLLIAGDDFRGHTLWHLDRWSKDKESKWDKKVLRFLQKAWPKHKKIRTSKTSARLCEIALKQKGNFPAVSKQVAQLVSKVGHEFVHIPQIRKTAKKEEEGDNLAFEYPEDYLNLLYTILPDQPERWPYGSVDVLKHIGKVEPALLNDPRLIELKSRLNDL